MIELLPQLRIQGGHSEQPFSKVITYDMALSVSHRMGAEVSVPRIAWGSKRSRRKRDNGNLRLRWLRGSRAQCPVGPRTHGGDDPAKVVDIRFVGTAERANVDEALPAVQTLEEKALLGQQLLGQRILC